MYKNIKNIVYNSVENVLYTNVWNLRWTNVRNIMYRARYFIWHYRDGDWVLMYSGNTSYLSSSIQNKKSKLKKNQGLLFFYEMQGVWAQMSTPFRDLLLTPNAQEKAFLVHIEWFFLFTEALQKIIRWVLKTHEMTTVSEYKVVCVSSSAFFFFILLTKWFEI